MATRSPIRDRLPARRVGDDLLRLEDGSLRAVVECGVATASPLIVLRLMAHLDWPIQVVAQARRPLSTDGLPVWSRLRAANSILLSRLRGDRTTFTRRLLVVTGWDVAEGDDGLARSRQRVDEARQRLDESDLDPAQLAGVELDAITDIGVTHEARHQVHAGGRLARTLIVTRLAQRLAPDCLEGLAADHDLSFHLRPGNRAGILEVSAYITLWSATRDDLDAATEHAEALLVVHGIHARWPHLQAGPAHTSGAPLGLDRAGAGRALTIDPASPHRAEDRDDRSLLYGADPATHQPLMVDRFALERPHAVVLGNLEDRARVLLLELVRARLAGRDVHLVDSTGQLREVVLTLGGKSAQPAGLDVLSVPAGEGGLEGRVQALLALIDLVAGGLSPAARPAVEDIVRWAYASHGFTYDGDHAGSAPPTWSELAAALRARGPELAAVAESLKRYTDGDRRHVLDARLASPRLGQLSLHDLSRWGPGDQTVAGLLSLDRLWHRLPTDRPTLIALNGLDGMLAHGPSAQFVAGLMAAASERRFGLTLAPNDPLAILRGPLREAALAAGMTILHRQGADTFELLAETYGLTPDERAWLRQAAPTEGLLIVQGRRLAFRAVASEEEERLVSSPRNGGATT